MSRSRLGFCVDAVPQIKRTFVLEIWFDVIRELWLCSVIGIYHATVCLIPDLLSCSFLQHVGVCPWDFVHVVAPGKSIDRVLPAHRLSPTSKQNIEHWDAVNPAPAPSEYVYPCVSLYLLISCRKKDWLQVCIGRFAMKWVTRTSEILQTRSGQFV